jgi:hypothetical protein
VDGSKDFLRFSGFLFDFLIFLLTWHGHVGASWSLRRARASPYGAQNRTAVLLDRETGPARLDLALSGLWQSSCKPRSRASLRNIRCKYEARKLNSINKIN